MRPLTWSAVVDLLYKKVTRVRKERKNIGMHSWIMVPNEALSIGIVMIALQ